MIRKTVPFLVVAAVIQLQAGDPLKVVREKGFYKTGAAAKNSNFVEWLARPVFGEGSSPSAASSKDANASHATSKSKGIFGGIFGISHRKVPPALQVIRDEGYKEKEARYRAAQRAKSSSPQKR